MSGSYKERTMRSVLTQCEVRGIPREEAEKICAGVEEMDERALLRFNRNLPHFMKELCGGQKRRSPAAAGEGSGESAEGSVEVITAEDVAVVTPEDIVGG